MNISINLRCLKSTTRPMSQSRKIHIFFTTTLKLAGTENHCLKIAELFTNESFAWIYKQKSSAPNAESEATRNIIFFRLGAIRSFLFLVSLRMRGIKLGVLYCVTPTSWIFGSFCKILLGCDGLTLVSRNNTSHKSRTGRLALKLFGNSFDHFEINSNAAFDHFEPSCPKIYCKTIFFHKNF